MTLYRVLRPLTTGHSPGQLVDGKRFRYLDTLVKAGALAPVSSPPLPELPGWKTRAEKLAVAGVVTVQHFLDADDEALKEIFNYKTTRNIKKWKEEATQWLMVEPKKNK